MWMNVLLYKWRHTLKKTDRPYITRSPYKEPSHFLLVRICQCMNEVKTYLSLQDNTTF